MSGNKEENQNRWWKCVKCEAYYLRLTKPEICIRKDCQEKSFEKVD